MSKQSNCVRAAVLFSLLCPGAAFAADPTSTGVLAGLGLVAGSGKTTAGGSAGAIEAAILSSEAFLASGRQIRAIVAQAASDDRKANYSDQRSPTILLLSHSDTLDFTMARWVGWRLKDLVGHFPPPEACKADPKKVAQDIARGSQIGQRLRTYSDVAGLGGFATPTGSATLSPADLTGMLTTDVSLSGLSLSEDDRLLLDAILINKRRGAWVTDEDGRTVPPAGQAAAATVAEPSAIYRVPGETIDIPDPNKPGAAPQVFKDFVTLENWAGQYASCDSDGHKAYLATIQSFVSALTAADKGTPALATAAELSAIADSNPYVLRLAIEQAGGTAITRSNIWYELGFPGAATVNAGILVTFRLSDPRTGMDLTTGYVRCAVQPLRLASIPAAIRNSAGAAHRIKTTCGVVSS